MKLRILGVLALLGMIAAFPAYALDLQEARQSGLVAEKLDGYIVTLKETPDLQVLVQQVNAKRRQEYLRISGENNQDVEVVARLAATQIINNLAPGSRYQAPDGSLKTR